MKMVVAVVVWVAALCLLQSAEAAAQTTKVKSAAALAHDVLKFSASSNLPPRFIVTLDRQLAQDAVEEFVREAQDGLSGHESRVNILPLKKCTMAVVEMDESMKKREVEEIAQVVASLPNVVLVEADSIIVLKGEELQGRVVKPHGEELQGRVVKPHEGDTDEPIGPSDDFGASLIPDDYFWSLQYGMRSIMTPDAWDIHTGAEPGAYRPLITVIDSGIDYTHLDLIDNIWVNDAEANGIPGVDDDGNGYIDDIHGWNAVDNTGDPFDDYWHGTHVAGIIGAVTNNNRGVAGTHWNPLLQGCKFLTSAGSGATSGAIICIDYSIATGAWISNNSWGSSGYSPSLFNAITRSYEAGQLFVAAAGNSGVNTTELPYYPASYAIDSIIGVASIDEANDLLSSSNYGLLGVEIAAPGDRIASTYPGGGYAYGTGTSMAAPHVSGVACLMKTAYTPLTAALAKQILSTSILPINQSGQGRVEWEGKVDASAAVATADSWTTTTTTADPTATTTTTTATTTTTRTATTTTTRTATTTTTRTATTTTTRTATITTTRTATTTTTTTATTTTTTTATTTTTTTATTTTTRTATTTTTTVTSSPCSSVVMGASTVTCEDSCVMRGLECDDSGTAALNSDVDVCFIEAGGMPLTGSFLRDADTGYYIAYPAGCYATFWKGAYTIAVNDNGFGSADLGCNAPPATMAASFKICKCLHDC